MASLLAITYAALVCVAVAFQFALAAGAPWGRLAMGGKWPGRLPPVMRVAAIVQSCFLAALAVAVLSYAVVLDLALPTWTYWLAVIVTAMSAVLNTITPSIPERRLWSPITIAMLISVLGAGYF